MKKVINTWVFYTEDGDYAFKIKAFTCLGAYNNAYDSYGPQVDGMFYQLLEHCPQRIKDILTKQQLP